MSNNLVDSTTVHGVDSLFRVGDKDPWGAKLAGRLADFFVYSDTLRYPVPDRGDTGLYDIAEVDSLLHELVRRDSDAFAPQTYSTAEPRQVADEHLAQCFERFDAWVRANERTFKRWLAMHHEPWVRAHRQETTVAEYTFDLARLEEVADVISLESHTGIPQRDILYGFDSVLKFPIFGELTGPQNRYLNHDLRDAIILPTMQREVAVPPRIAVSFARSISRIAHRLSREDYTVLLHRLRGAVRDRGVHLVGPGELDNDTLREIEVAAELPPRVRDLVKATGVVGGVVGGLGAIGPFGPPMAMLGGAIAMTSAFWKGYLPRGMAKIRWLRWAVEWDEEKQIEPRSR